MTIQADTWNFLRTKGLTESATSAVMGNIQWESGFDPNILEGQNGIGYGLCQWSYGRRIQLEAYGTDIPHQLNFLWSELTGQNTTITGADLQYQQNGYLTLQQFLTGTASIDSLTESFCFSWERPAVATAHLADRQTAAAGFYTQFTGQAVAPDNTYTNDENFIMLLQTFLKYVHIPNDSGYGVWVTGTDDVSTRQSMLRCKMILQAILGSGKV